MLRHRNDFARLRTQGKAIHMPLFVLSYHANDLSHNRYGFVASRRIGNAVMRNKVRRRLREAIYRFHHGITGSNLQNDGNISSFDVTLIARKSIAKATFQEIFLQLDDALHRAELLEN